MESYGMALAEARTMGLPVLAVSGGNVSAHVSAQSGGRLCADPSELAEACVELAADARARTALLALARRAAPPPRPWSRVADEFVVRVRALVGA
jgi:glycosyltransferase involved in cell wall biosynthesis